MTRAIRSSPVGHRLPRVGPDAPGVGTGRLKARALMLGILVLTMACGPSGLGGPQATGVPPTVGPIALPTAKPRPTIVVTVPATQELPQEDLAGQAEAMVMENVGDIDQFPGATRYAIKASVTFNADEGRARIEGQARILFTNPLDRPLDDLVLMLWPNDAQYRSSMQANAALIDGIGLSPQVELDGIALRYLLPESLAPGETLDASLPFEVEATGPIGGSDPKRFGITDGMLAAPTFYPLVPRLVDGEWQVEAAPPGGDTTNSDVAFYHVELTVPVEYGLATSGVSLGNVDNGDGTTTVTLTSGPLRDFAFALGPFVTETRSVEDVAIKAWVLPQHAGELSRVLDLASDQLRVMTEDVGPYPYTELDLVDAPGAFGGIEYPGLVFIGTIGTPRIVSPIVHEVAHQWFYGLIGNDQLNEPWLDEAAATYAETLFYEGTGSPGSATGMLSELRSRVRSSANPERPIGLPVADYPSTDEYATIVYSKGALFFEALRNQIGDEAFFNFLRSYYTSYRYGFVTTADFQVAAESACGCRLVQFFEDWVTDGGDVPGL